MRFHQCTFDRGIIVLSDHEPPENIMKKPRERAPKRFQGMMLPFQRYDVEMVYLQGKPMFLADTLSTSYISVVRQTSHE